MKELLKNLGLLIILGGVIFLGIVVFLEKQNNTHLAISLLLIAGGLISHIMINKYINK
ncbi:MAG: hypothetical protein JXR52_10350 [Bacteroidales bacterium]|nr:hypothetical protein [Bacteroidales bacterium]MBN2699214.1 hypothetical protein [Bacteroidales bacterium]